MESERHWRPRETQRELFPLGTELGPQKELPLKTKDDDRSGKKDRS